MNKIYFFDPSTLAFQPIIDLSETNFSNLSSSAVSYWLNQEYTPAQWGAFMHFYGPTRVLLKAGGLCIEEKDFLKVHSSNIQWTRLVDRYLNDDFLTEEKLYFVRLLYYMGFYSQAIDICDDVLKKKNQNENYYWSLYLKELGEGIKDPQSRDHSALIKALSNSGPELSSILTFHINLLLSKFYIRQKKDIFNAKLWLDKISVLIQSNSFTQIKDYQIGIVRFWKYQAEYYLLIQKELAAIKVLENAILFLDKIIFDKKGTASSLYLFLETKRRVLDVLYFINKQNNPLTAYQYIKDSLKIDPYCSYANALAADIALQIDLKDSIACFKSASQLGVIERSYAQNSLSSIRKSQPLFKKELYSYCNFEDLFLLPEAMKKDENNSIEKLPIEIKSLEKIANNLHEFSDWQSLKNNEIYQRFLAFWELKDSKFESPIFSKAPLVAMDVFQTQNNPWFTTLYLQRAMPKNFREELFFGVSPHVNFSQVNLSQALKLEILLKRSKENNTLFMLLGSIHTFEKLKQIQLCRILGSMGFYKEALQHLPILEKNEKWEIEDEYSYCTKLFLEHIYFDGTNFSIKDELEFTYKKLNSNTESLRMRLVLTMLAIVYYAKQRNIPVLKSWKDRGLYELNRIQNDSNFNEFEKQLLTSRFYRAISFYSFLTEDLHSLEKEAETCETLARNLECHKDNALHRLLYLENQFPMMESMSRIYDKLGDFNRAVNLMEEIVTKVDAYDAKAWIQVGELRERSGALEFALEAYLKAAKIGVPLGNIAWYKTGRTYEKMGLPSEAIDCYFNSLKAWPKGLSPLKRIRAISKENNNLYLHSWAEKNLNHLKSCYS